VRSDLFARHKNKHEVAVTSESGLTEEPEPAAHQNNLFRSALQNNTLLDTQQGVTLQHAHPDSILPDGSQSSLLQGPPSTYVNAVQTSYVRTGADTNVHGSSWQRDDHFSLPTTSGTSNMNATRDPTSQNTLGNDSSSSNTAWLSDQATFGIGPDAYIGAMQANDNFATWLFDSPGSQEQGFDLTHLPFIDFGLDCSPNDIGDFDQPSVPVNVSDFASDESISQSAASRQPAVLGSESHTRVSDSRRDHLTGMISSFLRKKRSSPINVAPSREGVLSLGDGHGLPNLTSKVLEFCLAAFWRDIAKQIPIIHQPTFSCEVSEDLLLLAMISLGASQLVRLSAKGSLQDYRNLADLIAINLRWEIFTEDDAQPPVQLWVAQALLLLELYEKMFTTRRLHERAHIHHASTITLLRRGSPLVGRSDSESPSSELPTRSATPVSDEPSVRRSRETETMRWWRQWARNESMYRVVFAAFQMDSLHAVMFGHDSALFPYEIRLPLPCDDALWSAQSPEELQRLDATFTMHGIKPIIFLDGLKKCLHGHDVQSHHHARLILVTGLLSVGWHINRRERHMQFLETVPSSHEHERWRSLLFNAYGHWRRSFESALASSKARRGSLKSSSRDFADPTVLYHLAHITMHTDIIDLQILAGYKRLISRKISERDHTSAVHRMKIWASTAGARLVVLHSFKLLRETLIRSDDSTRPRVSSIYLATEYSCRADPSVYRPWTLYLATLTIWAYQYVTILRTMCTPRPPALNDELNTQTRAFEYIANCAAMDNPDRLLILASAQGCVAVIQTLSNLFASAESELLEEASRILRECGRMLTGPVA